MNIVPANIITRLRNKAFKLCNKNNDQELLETYSDLLAQWAVKNAVEVCLRIAINEKVKE